MILAALSALIIIGIGTLISIIGISSRIIRIIGILVISSIIGIIGIIAIRTIISVIGIIVISSSIISIIGI